jgi:hypothetical protein
MNNNDLMKPGIPCTHCHCAAVLPKTMALPIDKGKEVMPYIRPDLRNTETPYDAGTLNFMLTKMCLAYCLNKDRISYALFNEVIGVLECVKHEFYRRAVVPYEIQKMTENGDVYESMEYQVRANSSS